jgi:hypothetical protein
MWSLARCVAELARGAGAVTVEAAFKLPILLPATVTLHRSGDDAGTTFALRDREGVKPHLTGAIRPI